MRNLLARSLSRCSTIADNYRDLFESGLPSAEVDDIFYELDGWLKMKEHPSPDIWEGPNGWFKEFSDFIIEGRADGVCPIKVWRKDRYPFSKKTNLVDLDRPETWKKRPISKSNPD
jgi:hypothetical protein